LKKETGGNSRRQYGICCLAASSRQAASRWWMKPWGGEVAENLHWPMAAARRSGTNCLLTQIDCRFWRNWVCRAQVLQMPWENFCSNTGMRAVGLSDRFWWTCVEALSSASMIFELTE
jgi:hypothetical protein